MEYLKSDPSSLYAKREAQAATDPVLLGAAFARCRTAEVRAVIAANRNTPAKTLVAALSDRSLAVQLAAASNPSTPAPALQDVAWREDGRSVAYAAVRNPALKGKHLAGCYELVGRCGAAARARSDAPDCEPTLPERAFARLTAHYPRYKHTKRASYTQRACAMCAEWMEIGERQAREIIDGWLAEGRLVVRGRERWLDRSEVLI